MTPAFPDGDWQNPTHYEALYDLDRAGLAWEFVRRDPGYRSLGSAFAHQSHAAEGSVEIIPDDPASARTWGLSYPEDQNLPAGTARIFWRADVDPHVLLMEAEPAAPDDPVAVDLAAIGGELFVQPRLRGGERVLLRQSGVHLRLDLAAGTVLDGPIRPRVVLPGIWGISPQLLTLKRLGELARQGRVPRSLRPREKRAWRWARMLQALDGMTVGATHRDIANAIFGTAVVRSEWRGASDHLRLKVQRLVREARRLAGGGYRAILKSDDG